MKNILLCCLLFAISITSHAQGRPNIILIVSDDHAYQAISAYSGKFMLTPNIDRIAKEGMLFRKAYITNSICGPSRAVLLTGKYSHKNGFRDNEHSLFDSSQNTFVKELKNSGYQTAWIGKWHLGTTPQGFDHYQVVPGQGHYFNPEFIMMDGSRKTIEGYATNIIEDLSEEWLNGRDPNTPFCLVIGHKATHRTWMPDTQDLGMFDKVNFPLPHNFYDSYDGREAARIQDMTIDKTMLLGYDLKMQSYSPKTEVAIARLNKEQLAKFNAYYKPIEENFKKLNLSGKALVEWKYQRYMRDYLSTAASLDRNIGRTLNYLDRHKLAGNTIVIYISDQGFYMGEHGWFDKRFMYEESFRTPMVMRYPAMIKPGTVNDNFVMNLDIAPTLLQAAGVKVPGDIQGKSFLPTLKDRTLKGPTAMYYHYYENGEHSVSPHFGIRTKRYKLIRFYTRVNSWELFDLDTDKNELTNLYGKKGYEKITSELKSELLKLIDKYEDDEARKIVGEG